MIAFWTGAGGWIVVMYGALNTIPDELEEAARIDGAGPVTIALRLKLPLIRKWIAYMIILSFATGTQLFIEPQLVNEASLGLSPTPGRRTSWRTSWPSGTGTSTPPPPSPSTCS
jgi:ABC-type sugar transport systems, permease components